MNTEWITDRLPTEEDAVGGRVLISNKAGEVYTIQWQNVSILHAWMPLPAPYVKPKRWTVKWDERRDLWAIFDGNLRSHLFGLPVEAVEAAQQIEDIYNEVMP
jgi:hypothetical protein